MDDDVDFAEYAAARWARLVRSAVFLGCTVDEAEDLVQTTLLRCFTRWDRVRKADELSEGNRQVVVLRYYAHLSEQQTAQVLGRSSASGPGRSRADCPEHWCNSRPART